MPRKYYIPTDDDGKAGLFERFRDNIGPFSGILGLEESDVSAQSIDATWFRYALNRTISMRDCGSQWTSYKNDLLSGTATATVPITPEGPVPAPPTASPGILTRFQELVRRVKSSAGYTDAIGEALGIIGPDHDGPDPITAAPTISLRDNSGQVEVVWNKDGMEAVEIQKDTGSGWQFLALDTRPNYTDTTPFPSPPQMWKYRASYYENSQRFGQWSPVVEITVGV